MRSSIIVVALAALCAAVTSAQAWDESKYPDWVGEWREFNRRHKTGIDGRQAPDANEEYRFYQTLLACWPPDAFTPDEPFRQRLRDHVRKAVNEAKVNTHWHHPNEAWLEACDRFVNALLTPAVWDQLRHTSGLDVVAARKAMTDAIIALMGEAA